MSHSPFQYNFRLLNDKYSGEFQTLTGFYNGSSVEATAYSYSNTEYKTEISVATIDGELKTVTLAKDIDIPPSSLITIIYFEIAEHYRPLYVYIHDTESMYLISEDSLELSAKVVRGWGTGRVVYARCLDYLMSFIGIVVGIIAACVTPGFILLQFFVGGLVCVIALFGLSFINCLIGGGAEIALYRIKKEIRKFCLKRAYELSDSPPITPIDLTIKGY